MNKRIIVHGKSYFVDTDIFSTGLTYLINDAHNSGDEEKINRVAIAVTVLAIGIEEVLKTPVHELGDVTIEIFSLMGELREKKI